MMASTKGCKMRGGVCFFVLLFGVLFAEEGERVAHFEGSPSGVAAGWVNVISGSIVHGETDLQIPGIEPLHISRTPLYAPNYFPPDKLKESWNFPFMEKLERQIDNSSGGETRENLVLHQGAQEILSFKDGDPDKAEWRKYKLGDHAKGFTNQTGGRPSGRTFLKNYGINRGEPHWMTLYTGSGEIRDYKGDTRQPTHKTLWLPLRSVFRPNGYRHQFVYDNGLDKQGVTVFTPTNHEVAHYGFEDRGDSLSIHSFDGRSVDYKFSKAPGLRGATCRFLQEVQRTDGPTVKYEYATENIKNGQLKKIAYPEGRGAKFDYWNYDHHLKVEGKTVRLDKTRDNRSLYKVQKLYQPAGPTAEWVQTHSFEYHSKKGDRGCWTEVLDLFDNKDLYLIDADYRLKEVQHFKGKYAKHLVEKFFWDPDGQLVFSALCDAADNPLRAKHYTYDDRGNITKEKVFGNLTGEGKALPRIGQKGEFNHSASEAYISEYKYSIDGKNLLTEEEHGNGLKVVYRYLEGSDLLVEKRTFAKGQWVKTETFGYDDDHCLIECVEDDGERKKIVRIKTASSPFGYPKEKQIFGWSDATGEVFLESYHYTYSIRGEITSEEKRDATGETVYRIEREYDSHGNCTSEINAVGDLIRREFDSNDNCTREEGPRAGLVKEYQYDWMNRCVYEAVLYLDKKAWERHYGYTQLGHRNWTTDEFGYETHAHLDRYGNAYCVDLPRVEIEGKTAYPKMRKTFDHFGNAIEEIDPLGHKTTKLYTSRNKPYFVEHPDGTTEHFRYTVDGLLSRSVDQEGVETIYAWDSLGRVLSKRTPFGTEYFEYKGMQLSRSVDLSGVETSYFYDPFGRLSETVCIDRKEKITYDAHGFPCRKSYFEADKLLSTEVTFRDPMERVVESYVEDPSGEIYRHKRFAYDGAGSCVFEWDGEAKTEKSYDGQNRVIRVEDALGKVHEVHYYKVEGDALLEKEVIDPLLNRVVTRYNSHGKEVLIRHFDRFGIEISAKSLSYDLADRLVKEETRAIGETRTLYYGLDSMGRVAVLMEPLRKVTRSSYTPKGQLAVLTKPDGVQLVHAYDKGRLSSLKSSDGQLAYTYTYSPRGELIEVVDEVAGVSSTQAFSEYGDLLEELLPTGQRIVYTYDGLGRVTSYSLPDGGEVLLEYNAITMRSVTRSDREKNILYTHAYTGFNVRGDVTETKLIGEGGAVTFGFDGLYQLKEAVHPQWSEKNLKYDEVGNLVSFELNGESYYFKYDNLYQLVEEDDHSYTFDPFRNRRSKDGGQYQVNELNELTSSGSDNYTYDANGNLIRVENGREALTFGYDPMNRLIFVQKGEIQVHFKYDPFHRRISENGKPFYFFREQEIGDEHSLRILGLGLGGDIGASVALELDGAVYAPLHDHNGSITALLDMDGNLVESWRYTAYGEQIGSTSSPWTFSSKRRDPLTHWLSFGRRDYDPVTGRWTTPDPLGYTVGPNLYTYVSNRPLTHRDPLGLFEMSLFFEIPIRCFENYLSESVPFSFGGNLPHVINYQQYEDDLPWWDRSNIYHVGTKVVSNKGVGFMNGVFNGKDGAMEGGQMISDLGGGVKVDVYHNSTHGPFDLLECGMGRNYIATNPVQLLHEGWSEFFRENPDGTYLMFCHSQGAIHVRNALLTFDPEMAKRIRVVAIAPGGYIDRRSCMSVAHYRTSSFLRDPIAHFSDAVGARREFCTIKGLESHPNASLFDHFFLSPTYQPVIQNEISDFLWES